MVFRPIPELAAAGAGGYLCYFEWDHTAESVRFWHLSMLKAGISFTMVDREFIAMTTTVPIPF